jgi:vitamin B12 transporter
MKTSIKTGLLISTCLLSNFSHAAEPEEIIITATRTVLTTDKLAASTSVLDRQDIAELQVKSLQDLLQGISGIDVTNSGGYGKNTDVRMRGTESDHVLVLVDGIRVGSATTGTSAFQFIPLTQVERIEIVRGPRSSVWGSEALGGVIHIITRKGDGEPRYDLSAGTGSNTTYEVAAGTSGSYGNFHYSGTVSYFESEGIDAREPTTGFFGVDQPDADGYDNTSIHLRGGYAFGARGELEAFILRAEGMTDFDGTSEDKTDYLQQTIGIKSSLNLLDNWTTRLHLGESRDEADNLALDGSFSSRFDTSRMQLAWQNEISFGNDQEISIGLDYRDDEVVSTNDYGVSNRDNLGVYGQYNGSFHGHHLVASVRHDKDEVFGGETTGGVGWSYLWHDWLKVYAAYGTAYKTPSFNELFFPGFGNPNLGPESAVSYEAGLEGEHDWLHWSIHAYRTDLDDLIVTVANPAALFGFAPDNVGTARIIGLEGNVTADWNNWKAALSAEILDPEDESTGNRLPRRVQRRLTFDLMHQFDNWSLGGRLLAEGDRFDDAGNTIRVGSFATVDLRADYRFNERITVRAKVGNLLDEDYHTIDTYRSLGRNFFVNLHYQSR